jgi:hypothetical protein
VANFFGPTAFPVIKRSIIIEGNVQGNKANGFKIERTSTSIFRFFAVDRSLATAGPTAQLVLQNVILAGGNSGTQSGGAILNNGSLQLYRCTIRDCRGLMGGAIYNGDTWFMNITSCIFLRNVATGSNGITIMGAGGAIYSSYSSRFVIATTTFKDNQAVNGWGGALYVHDNHIEKTVVRCGFCNNTAYLDNLTVLVSPTQPLQSGGTPSPLLARCNWWGNASGPGGPNGVPGGTGARVHGPASVADWVCYDICLDEMVFPVFGLARTGLSNGDLRPAAVARSYMAGHLAIDIVPIRAFQQACSELIDDEWVDDYEATPGSLKTVYAVTDGQLILVSTGSCEGLSYCAASLFPSVGIYAGQEFYYGHIQPINTTLSRPVKAGDPIGYVLRWDYDELSGNPSHLHFAYRVNSQPRDPRRLLITGLMDTLAQKRCRSMCPTSGCCPNTVFNSACP